MAGASLALLLAQKLPHSRIVLIEQNSLQASSAEQTVLPSFDARSTALSCSTQRILLSLGLWNALKEKAARIAAVHVSERHHVAGMLMRAEEDALPALGYVVENRHLGFVLLEALKACANVECLEHTHTKAVRFTADSALLTIEKTAEEASSFELAASLIVVADGSQSALRQQLGIAVDQSPYSQRAIIANMIVDKPHQGIAYERFTETGPIALLPLQDCALQHSRYLHRMALVWTVPEREAEQVLSLSDTDFIARVQACFGERCGVLQAAGARFAYPLVLTQAREQVRTRLVLFGNAAHSLHPVAGQGFNLILRDCLALANTLAAGQSQMRDVGELALLQQYLRTQAWDQQKTITASDWLPRLFSSRERAQKTLRTAALLGLDFLPGMRERFARSATGI